jgi:hypothetical protein
MSTETIRALRYEVAALRAERDEAVRLLRRVAATDGLDGVLDLLLIVSIDDFLATPTDPAGEGT